MQELKYYDEQVDGETSSLQGLHTRDMNLSITWGLPHKGHTGCLVSTSLYWVRGECGDGTVVDRVLSGEEALSLQGFEHKLQNMEDFPEWTLQELLDLAGNAFTAEVGLLL
jgi:hypothetical protein